MLKAHQTLAALFTTLMMTAAAPAFADYDDYLYQKNQSQYISHEQAAQAHEADGRGRCDQHAGVVVGRWC